MRNDFLENKAAIIAVTHFRRRRLFILRADFLFWGLFCSLLMNIAASTPVQAAGFEVLRPHRAVYNIKLDEASERSGIATMDGRIVYEMTGNECEGMSVRYRFVSNVNANGKIFRTDQQTSSHESPDGKEFSFIVRSTVNDQLDREVRGTAFNNRDGLEVSLSSPDKKVLNLSKAQFLSAHLVNVLEKAKAGQVFFKQNVFDAGDEADEVMKTTNLIGNEKPVLEILPGEDEKAVKLLGSEPAWPVTIGYFGDATANSSEQIPVYEVSFLLYEGGISRNLSMRYPDYTLSGTLVKLEILDKTNCNPKY